MTGRLDDIVAAISRQSGFSVERLKGPGRAWPLARCRMLAMALARHGDRRSLPAIGAYFSRDHSTVHHAIRQVERLRSDDTFAAFERAVRRDLGRAFFEDRSPRLIRRQHTTSQQREQTGGQDMKTREPWTDEEYAVLESMLESGARLAEIASALGRSYSSVQAKTRDYPSLSRPADAPWSQDDQDRLRDLARTGMPIEQIADVLNRTQACVRRFAQQHSIRITTATSAAFSDGRRAHWGWCRKASRDPAAVYAGQRYSDDPRALRREPTFKQITTGVIPLGIRRTA